MPKRARANDSNLILPALLAVIVVIGCDAWVRIPGRVVDQDGIPVPGAKIEVYDDNTKLGEETTKIDGRFDIMENVAPLTSSTIKVVVTKDGFAKSELKFNSKELPVNPNIDSNLPKERLITITRIN